MPPIHRWERHMLLPGNSFAKLSIELGMSSYELILRVGDERIVVANRHNGEFFVGELKKILDEGVAALLAAEKNLREKMSR